MYASTALWGISFGLLSATLPFRFQQLGIPVFEYGLALSVYAAGMLFTESLWGALAFRIARPGLILGVGAVVVMATLLLAVASSFPVFLVATVLLGAVGVYLAPLLRWVALSYGGPELAGSGAGRWSAMFGLGIAVGVTTGPLEFVTIGFPNVAVTSALVLAGAVGTAALLPWSLASLPTPIRGPRDAWRALATRPFAFALVLVVITFTAMTFTTNFLQYYSTVIFGGTPAEAGYVLGAARLVSLVAAFALGNLVDRWGTYRSIPAGFGLLLAGAAATWASHSYLEMIGGTLVFSAGIGWLMASILPMALESVPRDHQGTAIGVFGSFEDTGLLIGPVLFGATWATYGPPSIFPLATGLAAMGVVASLLVSLQRSGAAPATPAGDPAGPTTERAATSPNT